jgi:hypothetical protein
MVGADALQEGRYTRLLPHDRILIDSCKFIVL